MEKAEFLSPERQVVWLLHPIWGEWVRVGWNPEELPAADLWRKRMWAPTEALRWHQSGFNDPRVALRYVQMGWTNPEACRVVLHLSKQHGLGASSESRLLDGNVPLATVDAIHRQLHGSSDDLFFHEPRSNAAGVGKLFSLSVSDTGELQVIPSGLRMR